MFRIAVDVGQIEHKQKLDLQHDTSQADYNQAEQFGQRHQR